MSDIDPMSDDENAFNDFYEDENFTEAYNENKYQADIPNQSIEFKSTTYVSKKPQSEGHMLENEPSGGYFNDDLFDNDSLGLDEEIE